MEFDKRRVYSAVNADEIKPGSKVFVSDNLFALKQKVETNPLQDLFILNKVLPDNCSYRFEVGDEDDYMLCYLVSEPNILKWTDLKIGDVIQNACKGMTLMVTGIDSLDTGNVHISAGKQWLADVELENWEKVED